MWLTGRTKGLKHQIQITNVFIWIWMKRSKPKLGFLLQRSFIMWRRLLFPLCHHRSAVRWLIPAKALEILSFFHSQGWSYSSGGRSSSCGRRLSLGQRERSGSESPPFSAGSYGVSYRGSCLTDPSFVPLPVPPDRISMGKKKRAGKTGHYLCYFVCLHLHLSPSESCSTQTRNRTKRELSFSTLSFSTSSSPLLPLFTWSC